MTMGKPYEGLWTPNSATDWQAVVTATRGHFNADAAELQKIAAILRRELPHAKNVTGRKGMFGADLKIAAIQIARHWNAAAASLNAAAAALTKSDQIFHGNFNQPGGGGRSGRFDAGK